MSPPRPMCFVAMPFGRRARGGAVDRPVEFDRVYDTIRRAMGGEELECIRADFDPAGGFIHRSMFERLLVAEYVVADLSMANVNVAYELGLRHGASVGATFLVCESGFLGELPFDLRPLRVLPYTVDERGELTPEAAAEFERSLSEQVRLGRQGKLPPDNPILQVTAIKPSAVGHEKTDVFLERMQYASGVAERVTEALRLCAGQARLERLDSIADELLSGADTVRQLHSALLALYLAYRESKAYERMVSLYDRLPAELRETPVAREQLALALNRMAEASTKKGDDDEARELRDRALSAADLPEEQKTSETYGILGRIYKGLADAEAKAGREKHRLAALGRAIDLYEAGFSADLRDYYPGVNAVTLRILRGSTEDAVAIERLATVVRFSVERARAPRNDEERYWQAATRLELACAEREWGVAQQALEALLAARVEDWMRETTADNLARQREARTGDPETARHLTEILDVLQSG